MARPEQPTNPGVPTPPPISKNSGGSNPSSLGTNPGVITSTGGLAGINGLLLTPVTNNVTNTSFVLLMDPTNFNCEEDGEYDFPECIPTDFSGMSHEGEDVSCHLIILKYREIGYAKFGLNVTVYQRDTDSFVTTQYLVAIPPKPLTTKTRKQNFPDGRLHTLYIPIDVVGERPQVTQTRKGGSGAYSIDSLTLCGNADQTKQK